jgi:hypothetical protein
VYAELLAIAKNTAVGEKELAKGKEQAPNSGALVCEEAAWELRASSRRFMR